MINGDVRRRHTTTGDATTNHQTIGKREKRRQRTRGHGALISQGCTLRGGEESRGQEAEASIRQPADKRETTTASARATAMAMGNAMRLHHRTWWQLPWSLRLRLRLRSLQMMPMMATAVLPLSAARLLWWGVGYLINSMLYLLST